MDKIHKPYAKFKGWLRENNLTYRDIAVLLGQSVVTISAKINGQSDFTLSEVGVIRAEYGLDNSIFLQN